MCTLILRAFLFLCSSTVVANATPTFAWIGGANFTDYVGIPGNNGTYFPGARLTNAGRIDNEGNIWIFGGYGYGLNQSRRDW